MEPLAIDADPILVTPRAVEMGKKKLSAFSEPAVGIRIGIRGGGCSGLSYVFDFAKRVRPEKDQVLDFDGLVLIVDHKSLELLRGSTLDWSDDLVNHGFRWKNPKAKSACGCGESFELI